jgi:hypothetical protein
LALEKIMAAAMRLQSLAVTNQARLLPGPPAVMRLDAPTFARLTWADSNFHIPD